MNYISMQHLTKTVWKSYLCACVQVNSMCSKLKWIFKHIGVKAWAHAWSACHGILISKNWKMIRKTWNLAWFNVMPPRWCGKKLACLTKVWTHTPHKPEQLTRRFVVTREKCMFDDEREIASSYGLQIFPTFNVH